MATINFSVFVVPLIGLAGVLIGVMLNEYIRRSNRREGYASKIFEKRLEKYERLAELVMDGSDIAEIILSTPDLTAQDRHTLISSAILEIAQFGDRNRLYLDDELRAHCTALFMGVEDMPEAPLEDRENLIRQYRASYADTFRMIEEESGIAAVNKLFRTINNPRLQSPIIDRIRDLRREQRKNKKR